MQTPTPLIVIQWKEVAVLITALATATLTLIGVIWRVYKLGAAAFGAGVDRHVKPLLDALSKEIAGVSEAVKSVQLNHDSAFEALKADQELQREELDRQGQHLDEHDKELHEHDKRLALLEQSERVHIPPIPTK